MLDIALKASTPKIWPRKTSTCTKEFCKKPMIGLVIWRMLCHSRVDKDRSRKRPAPDTARSRRGPCMWLFVTHIPIWIRLTGRIDFPILWVGWSPTRNESMDRSLRQWTVNRWIVSDRLLSIWIRPTDGGRRDLGASFRMVWPSSESIKCSQWKSERPV